MSRHLQALEKSSAVLPEKPQKGHPFLCTIGFIPISQEMRYGLKIRKKNHFSQFGQTLTWLSWQPLLLKLQASSRGVTHHTRVKKTVASCNEDTWKTVRDPQNPLKFWFQKQWPSPTKQAETCLSHSRSWLVHAQQKHKDSSALLQPHSSSWLVNARRKLEDLAIKISMDFHCQPCLYPWLVLLLCSSLQD